MRQGAMTAARGAKTSSEPLEAMIAQPLHTSASLRGASSCSAHQAKHALMIRQHALDNCDVFLAKEQLDRLVLKDLLPVNRQRRGEDAIEGIPEPRRHGAARAAGP